MLFQSDVKTVKELHYKGMDKELRDGQKSSLVKANLAMSKGISSLILARKTNLSFSGKLKPIPESKKRIFV